MIKVKQHDTAWRIRDRLAIDGAAVDLESVDAVVFIFKNAAGTVRRAAATPLNPATYAGLNVEFVPEAADTAKAGLCTAEWEVTYSDGTILTFPASGYIKLQVVPDLD